jgi:hypothetical protein
LRKVSFNINPDYTKPTAMLSKPNGHTLPGLQQLPGQTRTVLGAMVLVQWCGSGHYLLVADP